MSKRRIAEKMVYSETGTHWLAGQTVTIISENTRPYEGRIVRVRGINSHGEAEAMWINAMDLLPIEQEADQCAENA